MRVAVICIGNELLMDEGAGPACGRYLSSRWELPDNVDVIDCATMGLTVISDLREHDYALVLDVVDVPGGTPGTLYSFTPDDVAGSGQMTSLHEMRFGDVLQSAQLIGVKCEGHCLGVQAENISPAQFVRGLTPRVAAAVPYLAATAARWLRDKLGIELHDRVAQTDPLRAGQQGNPEVARDFSGTRTASRPVVFPARWSREAESLGGWRDSQGVVWPLVYGEPDTSIATSYLAAGLKAVGALNVNKVDDTQVDFSLTAASPSASKSIDALIARFGLRVCNQDNAIRQLSAIVGPMMTDYDCDALIGACRDLTIS